MFAWLMIGSSGFFNDFRTGISENYVQFAFIASILVFFFPLLFDPSVSQALLEK